MTTRSTNEQTLCFIGVSAKGFLSKKSVKAEAERLGIQTIVLSENDIANDAFNPASVFVTTRVKSAAVAKLRARQCRVVGPQVIDWCIANEKPLPETTSQGPVLNQAMRGVVVSCTSLSPDERERIYDVVLMMGGEISHAVRADVTHLVAGSVLSEKYRVAVDALHVPIMTSDWVLACWRESQKRSVTSTDEAMMTGRRCPCFLGCKMSVTGLGDRIAVKHLIEENGGIYSGELERDECSHLVAARPSGDKYQYAQQWGLMCVSPKWLWDSAKAGVRLKETEYPVKEDEDEAKRRAALERQKPNFLAGCRIALIGDVDRSLRGMVNDASGTFIDTIDDTVTHVVGNEADKTRFAPSVFFVTPQWIVDCCKAGRRLLEGGYEVDVVDASEPFESDGGGESKSRQPDDDDDDNDDILKQYTVVEEKDNREENGVLEPTSSGVLSGKVFHVFDVTETTRLQDEIRSNGGSVSLSMDVADVLLVSIDSGITSRSSDQLVLTPFWLQMSIKRKRWIDPDDHPLYRPVAIAENFQPFRHLVFCVSQFDEEEREALTTFVELLGGTMQFYMARQDADDGQMKRTTHLLLKTATGEKYKTTRRWGVVPVTIHWPVECARRKERLPEDDFIVGDGCLADFLRPATPSESEGILASARNTPPPAMTSSTHAVPDAGNVLSGVVLFVSKKLSKQQVELHNLASSLGADYRYSYETTCTHVVHQGRLQDGGREIRAARNAAAVVVSPHWLYACRDSEARVDEAHFPHTYNPRKALGSVLTTRKRADEDDEKAKTDSDADAVSQATVSKEKSSENDAFSLTPDSEFRRHVDQLMSVTKGRRPSFRPPTATSDDRVVPSNVVAAAGSNGSDDNVDKVAGLMKASVSYENPSGREERERFLAHIQKRRTSGNDDRKNEATTKQRDVVVINDEDDVDTANDDKSEGSPEIVSKQSRLRKKDRTQSQTTTTTTTTSPPNPDPVVVVRRPAKVVPPIRVSPRKSRRAVPHFLMSGIQRREKDDYAAVIESLGGKFHDTDCFVSSATHLIAGRPTQSEKFLAMMASGRWILHKSFIEASRQAGRYVQEEDHEWGSVVVSGEPENPLALAAPKWRIKLADGRGGAFHDWKVLLAVGANRQAGMKRLLEAGGGKVVGSRTPFSPGTMGQATIAFVDQKVALSIPDDVQSIQVAGIPCLTQDYISHYLIQGEKAEKKEFLLGNISNRSGIRKRTGGMQSSSLLSLSKRSKKSEHQ